MTTDFGTETTAPDLTSQKFDASFAVCVVQKEDHSRKLAEMMKDMVSDTLGGSGILQGRSGIHP